MTPKSHDECAQRPGREQRECCRDQQAGQANQADQPQPGQLDTSSELEASLEEAKAKAAENWDLYLRARADLENYQRRVARDLDYNIRCGKRDLILRILGVVDDMERALAADADYDSLHSGVDMIMRKLLDALAAEGVKQIEAVGQPFDPRFHDAVAACEDPGVETETVVEDFRRGYTYGDDCLRPTMARVAKPC